MFTGAISPGQPQRSSASFTQMLSQAVSQQNGSIAHTLPQHEELLQPFPGCAAMQLPAVGWPQLPQLVSASFTHTESHDVLQQKGSRLHTIPQQSALLHPGLAWTT
jgi:hypothetical protein